MDYVIIMNCGNIRYKIFYIRYRYAAAAYRYEL